MRRIKEVLRLRYELGLGQRQIARSWSLGQSTVFDYLKRAEAAGPRWPLPNDWDDERLERPLFGYGQHQQRSPERVQPDFESIHEKLKRHSNLTLALLWEEYCQAQPDGILLTTAFHDLLHLPQMVQVVSGIHPDNMGD